MSRAVNPYGKRVTIENAHFVYQSPDGQWTWYVLRTYQTPQKEAANEYARWFCFVTSPLRLNGEYGDMYVSTVKSGNRQIANPRAPRDTDKRTTGEVHEAAS